MEGFVFYLGSSEYVFDINEFIHNTSYDLEYDFLFLINVEPFTISYILNYFEENNYESLTVILSFLNSFDLEYHVYYDYEVDEEIELNFIELYSDLFDLIDESGYGHANMILSKSMSETQDIVVNDSSNIINLKLFEVNKEEELKEEFNFYMQIFNHVKIHDQILLLHESEHNVNYIVSNFLHSSSNVILVFEYTYVNEQKNIDMLENYYGDIVDNFEILQISQEIIPTLNLITLNANELILTTNEDLFDISYFVEINELNICCCLFYNAESLEEPEMQLIPSKEYIGFTQYINSDIINAHEHIYEIDTFCNYNEYNEEINLLFNNIFDTDNLYIQTLNIFNDVNLNLSSLIYFCKNKNETINFYNFLEEYTDDNNINIDIFFLVEELLFENQNEYLNDFLLINNEEILITYIEMTYNEKLYNIDMIIIQNYEEETVNLLNFHENIENIGEEELCVMLYTQEEHFSNLFINANLQHDLLFDYVDYVINSQKKKFLNYGEKHYVVNHDISIHEFELNNMFNNLYIIPEELFSLYVNYEFNTIDELTVKLLTYNIKTCEDFLNAYMSNNNVFPKLEELHLISECFSIYDFIDKSLYYNMIECNEALIKLNINKELHSNYLMLNEQTKTTIKLFNTTSIINDAKIPNVELEIFYGNAWNKLQNENCVNNTCEDLI